MERNTTAKYKVLRDELVRAIRAGEFRAGQRLPAERDLAARFGVTHMTVRQAIAEMVDRELLERRPRLGIFVREDSQQKLTTTTLNLICSVSDSSVTTDFLKYATQYAEVRGWRTRITRSWQGYEDPLARAVRSGEPSLVFLNLPGLSQNLRDAMIHSNGCAVMIGNRMDEFGVPSVMADDRLAVQMAVAHLREAGHEKIAMLVNYREHPVVRVQEQAWRDCFCDVAPAELESRLISVSLSDFQSAAEAGYEAVAAWLKQPGSDATALLSINEMTTYGALFACQQAGLRMPEDISLICTLDSYILKFMQSGISVIDICMKEHVEAALNMVDLALAGELPPDERLHLVRPRLIERHSVSRRA